MVFTIFLLNTQHKQKIVWKEAGKFACFIFGKGAYLSSQESGLPVVVAQSQFKKQKIILLNPYSNLFYF